MSGIHMVKFFFLKGTMPRNRSEIQRVTTLAYQTAREQHLYPKQILIRWVGLFLLPCCSRHAYRHVLHTVVLGIPLRPLVEKSNLTRVAITLRSVTRANNKFKPRHILLAMVIRPALQSTVSRRQPSQLRSSTLRLRSETTSPYGQLWLVSMLDLRLVTNTRGFFLRRKLTAVSFILDGERILANWTHYRSCIVGSLCVIGWVLKFFSLTSHRSLQWQNPYVFEDPYRRWSYVHSSCVFVKECH
jgi:hypothetical protein